MDRTEELVSRILSEDPSKVFIQLPEGLKKKIKTVQKELDEEDVESVASLEPCYGACDIKDTEAKELGCDLLVHIGHTEFCEGEKIRTVYLPWYYDRDPVPLIKQYLGELEDYENIGLVATANFLPSLEKAREFLCSKGFNLFTEEGERTKEGQILGCDVSSAVAVEDKVDCYLYIGSGSFHPLGIASETEKPVLRLGFEEGELEEVEMDTLRRQQIVAVEKAREAEEFGILLTTKKGQSKPDVASELKDRLEEFGFRAYIFVMDRITPEKLEGIDVDCLVNTACPRLALEHRTAFGVPILNPDELEKMLSDEGW